MATLTSHIAHIISSFYHTLLELHAIPDFCISRKKNKKTGKVYLYKQESTRNGRKQTKIKAAEEADYLSLYEKRQKLKARLRELKAQYKTLSFKDRGAAALIAHCKSIGVHVFGSSVLPSISLSMFTMASIARFTRSEMIEVLDSDYMLLAESKGISGPALIFRHALRNALIPIITVLAPLIVDLMTGSLVVEKIFAIPGVGSLLVTAIQSNDYNVVIGLSFIYSAMYIGIMLVVDLLYGIIDPRIRLAKGDD